MIYGYTDMGTNWNEPDWGDKLLDGAFFFLPRANPDYHVLFPKIKKWCLEIDDAGLVNREIALDSEDLPVFHVPDGSENLGFWMDEDRIFSADELALIPKEEFERLWTLSEKQTRTSGLDS